ncbi:MAG: ATP-grasp domain-containing protein [Alphaproteobacteria bacterium]|nr:ATP-grasp domain-containing protein [Alphaproteobacteria bacterium]
MSRPEEIPRTSLEQTQKSSYELVVVLDDLSLKAIKESDLLPLDKLSLLPVVGQEDCRHIGSKIGLSSILEKSGIRTPGFAIATDEGELAASVKALGYPALIKVDFSSAGDGIFQCDRESDLGAIGRKIEQWPVLVQKMIEGRDIDLSAFYQDSKLVVFSYSLIEAHEASRFGPAALRKFIPLHLVESEVFDELRALGRALGANGFVNITCVKSVADQKRYFFEADMRPNVWVNHPRYLGDDPAGYVSRYFSNGDVLTDPPAAPAGSSHETVLPYFPRMKVLDLLTNRYRCWSYLPDERFIVVIVVWVEKKLRNFARKVVKPLVPAELWSRLKDSYTTSLRSLFR